MSSIAPSTPSLRMEALPGPVGSLWTSATFYDGIAVCVATAFVASVAQAQGTTGPGGLWTTLWHWYMLSLCHKRVRTFSCWVQVLSHRQGHLTLCDCLWRAEGHSVDGSSTIIVEPLSQKQWIILLPCWTASRWFWPTIESQEGEKHCEVALEIGEQDSQKIYFLETEHLS